MEKKLFKDWIFWGIMIIVVIVALLLIFGREADAGSAVMKLWTYNGTTIVKSVISAKSVADSAIFADSSLKALSDALGNTISSTYAPLASPTFTGTITFPSGQSFDGIDVSQLNDTVNNRKAAYKIFGDTTYFVSPYLRDSSDKPGADIRFLLYNVASSNGSSHARFKAITNGASSGDPYFTMTINGVTDWSAGIDNSATGDPFIFSRADVLGTNIKFTINNQGVSADTGTLGGQLICNDTSIASEGELEDSLDNYALTSALTDFDPDNLKNDATDNDKVDSNLIGKISLSVLADSAKKVDTNHTNNPGLLAFVQNNVGIATTGENFEFRGDAELYGQLFQPDRTIELDTSAMWQKSTYFDTLHIRVGWGAAGDKLHSQALHFFLLRVPQGYGPDYTNLGYAMNYGAGSAGTKAAINLPAACDFDCSDSATGTVASLDSITQTIKRTWFLFYTPYKNGSATYEDICLLGANNPRGPYKRLFTIGKSSSGLDTAYTPMPIISKSYIGGTPDHLADVFAFISKTARMYAGFIYLDANSHNHVMLVPSDDAVAWYITDTMSVYDSTQALLSPWIEQDTGGLYYLYGTNGLSGGSDTTFVRYKSDSLYTKCFGGIPETCFITPKIPPTIIPGDTLETSDVWHAQGMRYNEQHWLYIQPCESLTSGGGNNNLYFAVSDDGRHYNRVSRPVATCGVSINGQGGNYTGGMDSSSFYKSGFQFIQDFNGGKFYCINAVKYTSEYHPAFTEMYIGKPLSLNFNAGNVYGRSTASGADSTILTFNFYIGDTAQYIFTDSSCKPSGGTDSPKVFINVYEDVMVESLYVRYVAIGTGCLIDSIALLGPDISDGDNNADSTYWGNGTNRTTSTGTTIAYYVHQYLPAGSNYKIKFINTLAAQYSRVRVAEIRFKGMGK